mmetsp:Transcript_13838/g.24221  ORF Transcript_13838/g.24221 Transcript_13838/m.24221 type:complete len:1341 (-) Transcript_13838:1298-5320(-)
MHANVCTLIAALFPVWAVVSGTTTALPSSLSPSMLTCNPTDSLILVTNIAALDAQQPMASELTRTVAWALARMASHAAAASTALPESLLQQQLWTLLTGQTLLTVCDLLATPAKQDMALAKHCLLYIERVSTASAVGGVPAAGAACGDGSVPQFLRDALQLACNVAQSATDIRLQVSALKCMGSLLVHPSTRGVLPEEDVVVAVVLRITSLARFASNVSPKEVVLAQMYGMNVIAHLLLSQDNTASFKEMSVRAIVSEVHACMGAVTSIATDLSEARANNVLLAWEVAEATHEPDGGSCRLGAPCGDNHDEQHPGTLLCNLAVSSGCVLRWCADSDFAPAGVNSCNAQGLTLLHQLAATGHTAAVSAFLQAAGPAVELAKLDVSGNTAQDVASVQGHMGVTHMLSTHQAGNLAGAGFSHVQLGQPPAVLPSSCSPPQSNTLTQQHLDKLMQQQPMPAPRQPQPRVTTPVPISRPPGFVAQSMHGLQNRQQPNWVQWNANAQSPTTSAHTQSTFAPAPVPAASPFNHASQGMSTNWPGTALNAQPDAVSDVQALQRPAGSGPSTGASESTAFRVDTAMLSQLLSWAAQGATLPAWLAAGMAAAVAAQQDAVTAAAMRAGPGAKASLTPEDLALIADAEALLGHSHDLETSDDLDDDATGDEDCNRPSKHLWLGNLSTKLPRSVLKAFFESFGVVDDVVTFPGRMYAFVNYRNADDATRAVTSLNDREVPSLTGARRLVVKFRPSKKALGKTGEGPGADALAALRAAATDEGADTHDSSAGKRSPSKSESRLSICSSGSTGPDADKTTNDQSALGRAGSGVDTVDTATTVVTAGLSITDSSTYNNGVVTTAKQEGVIWQGDSTRTSLVVTESGNLTEMHDCCPLVPVHLNQLPTWDCGVQQDRLNSPAACGGQAGTNAAPNNTGTTHEFAAKACGSAEGSEGGVVSELQQQLMEDEAAPEPAINLSNQLNPNNVHFDKELAVRYKRMSKAEKEALWAQDRAMQQLTSSGTAAQLLAETHPGLLAGASGLDAHQLAALQLGLTGMGSTGGGGAGLLAALSGLQLGGVTGLPQHLLPHPTMMEQLLGPNGMGARHAVGLMQPAQGGLRGQAGPAAMPMTTSMLLQQRQLQQQQQLLQLLQQQLLELGLEGMSLGGADAADVLQQLLAQQLPVQADSRMGPLNGLPMGHHQQIQHHNSGSALHQAHNGAPSSHSNNGAAMYQAHNAVALQQQFLQAQTMAGMWGGAGYQGSCDINQYAMGSGGSAQLGFTGSIGAAAYQHQQGSALLQQQGLNLQLNQVQALPSLQQTLFCPPSNREQLDMYSYVDQQQIFALRQQLLAGQGQYM